MVVYPTGELCACTAGSRGMRRTSSPNYEVTTLGCLPTGRHASSLVMTSVHAEQWNQWCMFWWTVLYYENSGGYYGKR